MIVKRRWGFGVGTIFSLIVIYFIYLYSKDKGWGILAFVSKWYLIIVGGLIALSFAIVLLVMLFSLFLLLLAALKIRKLKKRKSKEKEYVNVEYKIKE